ncbi:MAG: RNA polymerase sigma factor SigJ [Myxococcales bacterium]|nr:RNA polymerase sigma factor SigJ [Myxococcales bacterium]
MAFDWAKAFEEEREHLFAVAYRMLGSATEADDVLQDAWLRVRDTDEIPRSARAMLTTVVVRLCLDELKSARARRETYVGPWLPEPIAGSGVPAGERDDTPETAFGLRESVSMGLLVVLESLSPLERAAFLLREAFDYDFAEIAVCLGRAEAACRQLHHRARAHVEARHTRFHAKPEDAARLATAFLAAVGSGDTNAVVSLLAADAVATSDGGGRVTAARKPIVGAERVAAFFLGVAKKAASDITFTMGEANGEFALFMHRAGHLFQVITVVADAEKIHRIHLVLNPEKLVRLERVLARPMA